VIGGTSACLKNSLLTIFCAGFFAFFTQVAAARNHIPAIADGECARVIHAESFLPRLVDGLKDLRRIILSIQSNLAMHRHGFAVPERFTTDRIIELHALITNYSDELRGAQWISQGADGVRAKRLLAQSIHDLNNDLNPIAAQLELLKGWIEDRQFGEVEEGLAACLRRAETAMELATVIADPDFIRSGGKTDVAELVHHPSYAEKEQVVRSGATLTARVATRHTVIDGQRTLLRSVITNLVINAAKAIKANPALEPGKGRIEIAALDSDVSPRLWISQSEPGVVISVTDNGIGMTPEEKRAALRFGQTSGDGGRGYGLSSVTTIVEDHGGSIEIESDKGVGTSFHVYLPLVAPKFDEIAKPVQIRPVPTLPPGTILVGDSREDSGRATLLFMKHLGYESVVWVRSWDELLAVAAQNYPNIRGIFTELVMPSESRTVLEALHELSSLEAGFRGRIIVATASPTLLPKVDHLISRSLILPYEIKDMRSALSGLPARP